MSQRFPGRDRKAWLMPAAEGLTWSREPRSVTVVGGGIAGLAAAFGLAERGVDVTLVNPDAELGGRVRSWEVNSPVGPVTMSRGFHAFFRQYYNLRALLSRAGSVDSLLKPIGDYPVVSSNGDSDSFLGIPRTPPWNLISFVNKSDTFDLNGLRKVDVKAAMRLLDVDFPQTYRDFDGVSAAEYLDSLRFPQRARHLALEVFARSFFADPRKFSAGEMVAMFHTYFVGSSEGLLFDVPSDDFDTSLWGPLSRRLDELHVEQVTGAVTHLAKSDGSWVASCDGEPDIISDAVVLAAGPGATRQLVANSPDVGDEDWRRRIDEVRIAPAFAVWRVWTDRPVDSSRPGFLGTAGFTMLDNVSVLERFEDGAAKWSKEYSGSVLELHAYALDEDRTDPDTIKRCLREELEDVFPETIGMEFRHQELLIERDCSFADASRPWDDLPTSETPDPTVKLAGDWVSSELPIALMERAATTGWSAANGLLESWGLAGHDLWSPPSKGRHAAPRLLRKLTQGKTQ